jgi:hypothetical protein
MTSPHLDKPKLPHSRYLHERLQAAGALAVCLDCLRSFGPLGADHEKGGGKHNNGGNEGVQRCQTMTRDGSRTKQQTMVSAPLCHNIGTQTSNNRDKPVAEGRQGQLRRP